METAGARTGAGTIEPVPCPYPFQHATTPSAVPCHGARAPVVIEGRGEQ